MARICREDGRQQISEANAVWKTRRKKEERETPVDVVRQSGEGLETDRSEEMEAVDRNEWQRILEGA
jgi:K+-transporting ATPase c subunit